MDFACEVLVNIDTRTRPWLLLAGRYLVTGLMAAVGIWGWRWLRIGTAGNAPPPATHAAISQETIAGMSDQALPDDPADAFARFVATDSPSLGMDRAWMSGAVVRLSRAIAALVDANGLDNRDVRIAVLDLRARGRALARIGPDALMHADIAREAFVWAASLLASVQAQQAPRDASLPVRIANLDAQARAIRPDEPLTAQQPAVRSFLRNAAELIQRLAHGQRAVVSTASGT